MSDSKISEELQAGIERIQRRFSDGYYTGIDCGEGWYSILVALDEKLAALDSGYRMQQVKEKFGGLRYYYSPSDGVSDETYGRMKELVRAAEVEADRTCEVSGRPGVPMVRGGWYRTLNPEIGLADGFELLGEDEDD